MCSENNKQEYNEAKNWISSQDWWSSKYELVCWGSQEEGYGNTQGAAKMSCSVLNLTISYILKETEHFLLKNLDQFMLSPRRRTFYGLMNLFGNV